MSADITPERIAEQMIGGEMHIGRRFAGYVDVASEGAVLQIGFTPKGKPSQIEHFRAVVVPGEDAPIVLSPQARDVYVTTDLTGALWLACAAPGCREPLTVVEDGKTLGELAAPWAAHACAGAAQAEQDGGQADG